MDEFINQLLQDKGTPTTVDPEVRAQLVQDLSVRADKMINRYLIDALSEEDALAFEKIIDEQPDNLGAMQEFIDAHVPNKSQVVGMALLEFRSIYLGAKA
jgi:hypothetical protein